MSRPTVLIVDPILGRVKRIQMDLGGQVDVLAAAGSESAQRLIQVKVPTLLAVSLQQKTGHGLALASELRKLVGDGCLITVYGRPTGKKVTPRARDKAAEHYHIDSFVPAQLNGGDISAMIWAHLKEAAREASTIDAGDEPDDSSLQGRRSWSDLLANARTRSELQNLSDTRPEPVVIRPPPPELRDDPPTEDVDPAYLETLRSEPTAGTLKKLLTTEIVKGKDLPEDGSLPSWSDLLQTRVTTDNLKRLLTRK
jgi:hypothetical protein